MLRLRLARSKEKAMADSGEPTLVRPKRSKSKGRNNVNVIAIGLLVSLFVTILFGLGMAANSVANTMLYQQLTVLDSLAKLQEEISINSYIVSLAPEEREKLRLREPRGLRERQATN